MHRFRFSTVILSLIILLSSISLAILLTPVYQGAEKALDYEIKLTHERDQRALSSLMKTQFEYISQISQELASSNKVVLGFKVINRPLVSAAINDALASRSGEHIDAIVIEFRDGSRQAHTNFSMLEQDLPLEKISQQFRPGGNWSSEKTIWNDQQYNLLRHSLPVIDKDSGQVLGVLHSYILLNDNYWIINQLQQLFGSQAISLSSDGTALSGLESQPGQLNALEQASALQNGVLITDNKIIREHTLRISNNAVFQIRSLLRNNAQLAMQDAYTTNLYSAVILVIALGAVTMLIIRNLINSSLRQVTLYAEQVPESGSPAPFKGAGFKEFIRVGNAIEKMLLRIRDHDKHLSSIVDNSPDLIFIKDLEHRYLLVNKRMAELVDQDPQKMTGGLDTSFWSQQQIARVRQYDQQVIDSLNPIQYEIQIQTPEGIGTFLVSKFPIVDDHKQVYAIGGIATDITKEKESEELVWHRTNFDTLTGLPNRHMFIDRLEQHVRKVRQSNQISAVLFINLDHFKQINDSQGYETGDRLIQQTVDRIHELNFKPDTIARIGGDEFAIILSELNDIKAVETVAQNILACFCPPFQPETSPVYLTCCIGIAFCPTDADSADTLIQCAGHALHKAKQLGGNHRSYYTPSIQESLQSKVFMLNELRTALTDNQLSVYYQPIIDLTDNSVYKAEALVRWQHPDKGFISPAEFIPVAEDSGFIIEIGNWIFRQAVRQTKQWRNSLHPEFQISINKSPVQFAFEDNSLYEWFEFIHKQGLPGQAVIVEMTEGVLMGQGSTINSKLFAIDDTGIELALDDFGTGYSSLSYIKQYNIDYLKIDQSFVKHLDTDTADAALCESIIIMAHRLGIKVIAEGVENLAQYQLLKSWGCDFAQGYLFSRPLPPSEFESWIAERDAEPVSPDA